MIALYVWEIQQVMIGGNVFSSLVAIVFYHTVGQMRFPKAVTILSFISTTRGNENSQRKMCDGLFLTLLLLRTSMSVSDTIVLTDEAKLN